MLSELELEKCFSSMREAAQPEEVDVIKEAYLSGQAFQLAIQGLDWLKNSDVPFNELTHPRCIEVANTLKMLQGKHELDFTRMGISVLLGGSMLSDKPDKKGDIDLAVAGPAKWLENAQILLHRILSEESRRYELDVHQVDPNDFKRYKNENSGSNWAGADRIYWTGFYALQVLYWRPIITHFSLVSYRKMALEFLAENDLGAAVAYMNERYLLKKRGLVE